MTFGKIRAVFALLAVSTLVNCGTTAGDVGASVRDTGQALAVGASDTSIHLALQRDLGFEFPRYFAEMASEVHEGRVLLVGTIRTPQDRIRASQIAWQVEGVSEVVNELQVAEEQSILAYMNDARISNQLRLRLLTARDVWESNFDFETVNSVVYILGVARDQKELEYVAELAATVGGVERVVSHALLATALQPPHKGGDDQDQDKILKDEDRVDFEGAVFGGNEFIGFAGQFLHSNDGYQRRHLQHIDELVAHRGQNTPDRLGQDDKPHRVGIAQRDGLRGFILSFVDGLNPGAVNFGFKRRVRQCQRNYPRPKRVRLDWVTDRAGRPAVRE